MQAWRHTRAYWVFQIKLLHKDERCSQKGMGVIQDVLDQLAALARMNHFIEQAEGDIPDDGMHMTIVGIVVLQQSNELFTPGIEYLRPFKSLTTKCRVQRFLEENTNLNSVHQLTLIHFGISESAGPRRECFHGLPWALPLNLV